MPSPLNQFTPDKQYADGFTLIEIVMVLVLLGILSAVAVPKYFDLQEEAIAKKCQHNRGVVQSSVITQYAAAQLDGTADSIGDDEWKNKINEVLDDLNGDKCSDSKVCKKLCEAGGKYTVTFDREDGNLVVNVTCDHEGHGSTPSNSDSDNSSTIFFGKSETDLKAWLEKHYPEFDSVFTEAFGGNRHAFIDGINDLIQSALQGEDYDLSKSVMLIQREDRGLYEGEGANAKFIAATPQDAMKMGYDVTKLHWRSELFVTIASTEGISDNTSSVKGTKYSMVLAYHNQKADNERDVASYGDLERKGDVDCKLEKVNGQYVLRPQS